MPDTPGHVATRRDDLHTLTLRELEAKIIQAGIVMSRRQIMRHCKAGTFDAQKLPATNNVEEWFIAPASVEKGIADIRTLLALRSRRDATRHDMTDQSAIQKSGNGDTDVPGHVATHPDMSRYVALLERNNHFLQEQVTEKDQQIGELNKRFSETQSLLGAMQRMFAPMLGQADPFTNPQKGEVSDTTNA